MTEFHNIDRGVTHSPQQAQAVMSQIQSQLHTIRGLFAAVQSLIAELQMQNANRPTRPDTTGMDEDKAKAVLAKYEQAMDKWHAQVLRLNDRLHDMQHKLHDADVKLKTLSNIDLPAAQQRDRDQMQKKLEQQQKALREAAKSLDTGQDTARAQEDETHQRRAELRVMVRKLETKHGPREFASLVVGQVPYSPARNVEHALGTRVPGPAAAGFPSEGE